MKGPGLILPFILLFSLISFSQNKFNDLSGMYKVVSVDSMPSHYLIFVSGNLHDSILLVKPQLIKIGECGSCLIESFDNHSLYCIISDRNDSFKKNINIGSTYKLSLDTNYYKTLQNVNSHLGFGDYLMQEPGMKVCTASEIVSLFYSQDLDSINKLKLSYSQKLFLDYSMINIWLHLDNSNQDCYYKWLKTKIKTSNRVIVKCKNECLELYNDPKCKMLRAKINCSTENAPGQLDAKLIYQNRRNGFIEINQAGNVFYGWVRKHHLR